MAPQTDLCTLLLPIFVLLNTVIAPVLHLLSLGQDARKYQHVEMAVTNLPFEFPYLKIQDKVNVLRRSLVLPMVS